MSDEDKQQPTNEAGNKHPDPADEEDEKDDETRIAEERAAREAARKRCYKYSDPPKVFTDVKACHCC